MIRTWAMGACVAVAGTAQAQDANFAARMRDLNAKAPVPDIHAIETDALATLQAIAQQKAQCSPSGVKVETPAPATADRMATQAVDAGRLKNVWVAYGMPQGCQGAQKTRFIVLQLPDGSVRARVVNKGESIASPSLMRDTTMNAALAAYGAIKAADATCDGKDMDMLNSKIRSKSADLSPDFYSARYQGSWEETWTFASCGRVAEVPVSFKADGQGGAYTNVSGKDVKLLAR